MSVGVATTADLWGAQVCNEQRHLLTHRQTTPAEATARIVHALHRMAGLTPPTKEKP